MSTAGELALSCLLIRGKSGGMHLLEREQLLGCGWTDAEIQRLVRNKDWTRLARGRYSDRDLAALSPEDQHAVRAVARRSRFSNPDIALSHVSAAVLHGMPLSRGVLGKVCLTRSQTGGARTTKDVCVRTSQLAEVDRVEVDGVLVTSVARTLIDLGRHYDAVTTVVAADNALARKIVTPDELVAAVRRMGSAPRLPRARRALEQADGLAESVGESRQHLILRPVFPTYLTQVEVYDTSGDLIGRADGALLEAGVLLEFDGAVKYGRYRRKGESIGDAVAREKKREDRLRALGWLVIRFTWDELLNPAAMIAKVRRAIAQRAGQPAPAGSVEPWPDRRVQF